jgi:parvulin-like peptidyl-prolyl isomerase
VKSIFQAFAGVAIACLLTVTFCAGAARAQEGEPVVVDEVIAQVNDQIIMLSQVRREMREAIEAMKSQGATEQQATEEVTKRRNEMIAGLINEQLLLQKAKDLNFTNDVEAEVNRRMLAVAKEQNIPTMQALEEAMRASGVDPATIRQRLRAEITKEMVFNDEVDRKIYLSITPAEAEKYFKAHMDQFKKPESVTLSEIWLRLARELTSVNSPRRTPSACRTAKGSRLKPKARSEPFRCRTCGLTSRPPSRTFRPGA